MVSSPFTSIIDVAIAAASTRTKEGLWVADNSLYGRYDLYFHVIAAILLVAFVACASRAVATRRPARVATADGNGDGDGDAGSWDRHEHAKARQFKRRPAHASTRHDNARDRKELIWGKTGVARAFLAGGFMRGRSEEKRGAGGRARRRQRMERNAKEKKEKGEVVYDPCARAECTGRARWLERWQKRSPGGRTCC